LRFISEFGNILPILMNKDNHDSGIWSPEHLKFIIDKEESFLKTHKVQANKYDQILREDDSNFTETEKTIKQSIIRVISLRKHP